MKERKRGGWRLGGWVIGKPRPRENRRSREGHRGESPVSPELINRCPLRPPSCTPQCQAAACINNTGDSMGGTGQTSNRHLPGNHHYGHHHQDNKCRAQTGYGGEARGVPLPSFTPPTARHAARAAAPAAAGSEAS